MQFYPYYSALTFFYHRFITPEGKVFEIVEHQNRPNGQILTIINRGG